MSCTSGVLARWCLHNYPNVEAVLYEHRDDDAPIGERIHGGVDGIGTWIVADLTEWLVTMVVGVLAAKLVIQRVRPG